MRTLWASIRQALTGRMFLASVGGIALVMALSSWERVWLLLREGNGMPAGFSLLLTAEALSSQGMLMALPVLSALPFTCALAEDAQSGFLRAFLSRTSRGQYLFSRYAACVLSGALSALAGIGLFFFVSTLLLFPLEAPGTVQGLRILPQIALASLSGGLWAGVGCALAAATDSRYMAYASPFIVEYLLIILQERYLPDLVLLHPAQWLSPGEAFPLGAWGAAALLAEGMLLAGLLYALWGQRRLDRL